MFVLFEMFETLIVQLHGESSNIVIPKFSQFACGRGDSNNYLICTQWRRKLLLVGGAINVKGTW